MDGIGAYVLSVSAAAVLCALAVNLAGEKGTPAAMLRLVSGIIMACVMVRPLGNVLIPDLSGYFDDLDAQVTAAVSAGSERSYALLSQRISQQTCAYILDKAAELGLTLDVQVELDDSPVPVPVRVVLKGGAAPSAKSALSEIITRDLGIEREDQIWN